MAKRIIRSNKIQVSLTDELLEQIDAYCSVIGLSRSSTVCVLCQEALEQKKLLDMSSKIMNNNALMDMIIKQNQLENK